MSRWQGALIRLKACSAARQWAEKFETLDEAWASCENPQWMMWLISKAKMDGTERKQFVTIACEFARLVLPKTQDTRAERCIEVVEAWVRGEVGIRDVKAARDAAYAAAYAAAAYAADTAAYAAYAAYAAAYAAAAYAVAAYAADTAADAADAAATYAHAADTAADIYRACADIVRKYYPEPPDLSKWSGQCQK